MIRSKIIHALFAAIFMFAGSFYSTAAVSKASTTADSSTIPAAARHASGIPLAKHAADVAPQSFTASWDAVPGAVSYQLDAATDEAFTQMLSRYNNYTVAGTSHRITGLSPNTTYYYRVRASYNGSSSENSNTVEQKTQKLLIILMAGQSNMAGRGAYSQLAPADTVTYSNILSLNKDSVWVRAKHPLHWDKSEAAVGMGISFARALLQKTGGGTAIGLVPCAAGGTKIDSWLNNEYFGCKLNANLYTNLINRARKAAQSGDIIGMIWHQGESDAVAGLHGAYQEKLLRFFTRLRTDLDMPRLPIAAGELGAFLKASSYNYFSRINTAMHNLTAVIDNYEVVSAEGLSANPDNIHFNAASQIELGKRYADVFYQLYSTPAMQTDAGNAYTDTQCFAAQGRLTVTGTGAYTIYGINGLKITDIKANTEGTMVGLCPGVYIVRTIDAEALKVIVK